MTAGGEPDRAARMIRRVAVLIITCSVAAAVLAPMPGVRTYVDRSGCADRAWGGLFTMEHGGDHERCTPDWVERDTVPAGDASLALLLLPTVVAGVLIARRPRRRWAALWSGGTVLISAVLFLATFDLDLDLFSGTREEILWPRQAMAVALQAIYLFHIAQLAVLGGAAIRTAVQRRRAARAAAPDPMPRATVVKTGDE